MKPVKLIKVRIPYKTVFGVQMQNSRFPISLETARHIELIVPETNERVIFSRKEVL
jgi:hypothetical protein